MQKIYIPYFYIIQDTRNGIYYAGSKYSKYNTDPSEFLKEDGYLTSSKIIKKIIYEHNINVFRICKLRLFKTGEEAYKYETRFLRKVNARENLQFYNGHNNDGYCDINLMKKRMIQKYGVENCMHDPIIKEKCIKNSKESTFKKYGVYHNFAIPHVRETIRKTNLEKYGKEFYSQTNNFKEKYKQTCIEKYGVEHLFQSEEIKTRKKENSLKKYGVEHYTQTDEAKKNLKEKTRLQFEDPIKKENHRLACIAKNISKGTIWINNEYINKRVTEEIYQEEYSIKGWKRGRLFSNKEIKFFDFDKTGENNPFYGKNHSDETKKNLSERHKKKYSDPDYKEQHKRRCKERFKGESGIVIWVNNGQKSKQISIEEYSSTQTEWKRGRLMNKSKHNGEKNET